MTMMRLETPSTSSRSELTTITATPLASQIHDQVIYGRTRADIDTACRFVQHHHFRLAGQPFRQDHLLLVSPGELSRILAATALDAELPDIAVGKLAQPPRRHKTATRDFLKIGIGNVFLDRMIEDKPLKLAILRNQNDAATDRIARRNGG